MCCLAEDLLRSVDCGLVVLDHIGGCRLHGNECNVKDAEPITEKVVEKKRQVNLGYIWLICFLAKN